MKSTLGAIAGVKAELENIDDSFTDNIDCAGDSDIGSYINGYKLQDKMKSVLFLDLVLLNTIVGWLS